MKNKRLIYEGRVISVWNRRKRLPNGHVTRLDIVQHPGAVLIVPFLTKDQIVFLKQFRPVVNRYLYELPAGTLEKKEKPLDCARREIIEETGFAAKTLKLIATIYPVPGYSTEKIHIFRAAGLREEGKVSQDDEIIESFVFSRKKIKRLFAKGEIIDAKTIAGLALCDVLC